MLQQVELVQDAVGHAQRVAHRRGAAGHGDVGEIGETLVGLLVGEQDLAAPHTAVGAVARAVERDAAHGAEQPVLTQHRGDVRMVVLHLGQGQVVALRLLASPFACKVLGVRIAGETARRFLEQLAIALLGLQPGIISFRILDVADMLRDERVRALVVGRGGAHQGERGLLLRTRGQQGFLLRLRLGAIERDGQRGEAAGAADELDGLLVTYAHHAQHRVVVARQDAAIVAQDGVGDAGELDQRLVVIGDYGLVMQVP